MKKFAIAAVAAMALSLVAQAATVTLDIQIVTTTKTWKVVVTNVTNDCAGLASFDLAMSFNGVTNDAAQQTIVATQKTSPTKAGFTEFRDAATLTGGQKTLYGSNNDAIADSAVVQGIGQAAHSQTVSYLNDTGLLDDNGLPIYETLTTSIAVAKPFVLVQGKYTNTPAFGSTITVTAEGGSVLRGSWNGTSGTWTGPGNADPGTFTPATYTFVPEPATMSLLGLGALALLRRRN